MAILEILTWWYTAGMRGIFGRAKEWFGKVADFFSMDSLLKTLFMPYRQISAERARADAPVGLKLQMFGDRLFSRIIGFFARIVLLLAGVVTMIFGLVLILALILLWPFIPVLPVFGVILTIAGVMI